MAKQNKKQNGKKWSVRQPTGQYCQYEQWPAIPEGTLGWPSTGNDKTRRVRRGVALRCGKVYTSHLMRERT